MTVPKSGQAPHKTIGQNEQRLVLPVTDHRNNPKFRERHPMVIFEGKAKPKSRKVKDIHSAQKHHSHTKTHKIVAKKVNTHHSVGGKTNAFPSDPEDEILSDGPAGSVDVTDSDEGEVEGGESWLFNEISDEQYDAELDNDYYNGAIPIASGPTEAVSVVDTAPTIVNPTQLSVSSPTVEAKVTSQDGIPTYTATLSFSQSVNSDDYEVRIVKQ